MCHPHLLLQPHPPLPPSSNTLLLPSLNQQHPLFNRIVNPFPLSFTLSLSLQLIHPLVLFLMGVYLQQAPPPSYTKVTSTSTINHQDSRLSSRQPSLLISRPSSHSIINVPSACPWCCLFYKYLPSSPRATPKSWSSSQRLGQKIEIKLFYDLVLDA